MTSLHHILQSLIEINKKEANKRTQILKKMSKRNVSTINSFTLRLERNFLNRLNSLIKKQQKQYKYLIDRSK